MKLIGYIRVSTQKQGTSGLGLDAQLKAVSDYAAANQGEIVQIYREVESGRKDDRPEFAKALAHAKRIKARLVLAKLDRLSRDVHFVSGLTKSGVDFVACDNPHANKLTIHLLAVMAEWEVDCIKERTKAALQAAKARGVLLGSARPGHWEGREHQRQQGAAKGSEAAAANRRALAAPIYSAALPIVKRMHDEGESLQAIADTLNAEGLTTVRGSVWSKMQVSRLIAQAGLSISLGAVLSMS